MVRNAHQRHIAKHIERQRLELVEHAHQPLLMVPGQRDDHLVDARRLGEFE